MNKDKRGFVYVIASEYGYKIGSTKNYIERFKNISATCPIPLYLRIVYYVNDYKNVERGLHKYYKNTGYHLKNEWFKITERHIGIITKRVKGIYNLISIEYDSNKKIEEEMSLFNYHRGPVKLVKEDNEYIRELTTKVNELIKENNDMRDMIQNYHTKEMFRRYYQKIGREQSYLLK